MIYEIENDKIKVTADTLGGEFKGLFNKALETEFVWQGDPAVWVNKGKNLFPNCGVIKDDYITVDGKKYSAIMHGFARASEFSLAKQEKDFLSFVLKSNEQTKEKFPFDFEFYIDYKLTGDGVLQTFRVVNSGKVDLPFGVGGHTGFNCPMTEGERTEDYSLFFSEDESLKFFEPKGGFITGNTREYPIKDNKIDLYDNFFAEGSVNLTNFKKSEMTLKSKKSGLFLKAEFENFDSCVIWSVPGKIHYVAIEPWCGLPDLENTDHDFLKKRGNHIIKPAESFERVQKFTCGKEN